MDESVYQMAVIGYGSVGRATAKWLKQLPKVHVTVADTNKEYARHVNEATPLPPGVTTKIKEVFVCIPITTSSAKKAAAEITRAIAFSDLVFTNNPTVVVRSTVPVGTLQRVKESLLWTTVYGLPEFGKEKFIAAGNVKMQTLGVERSRLHSFRTGQVKQPYFMELLRYFKSSSFIVPWELAEWTKLAHNVKQAAKVHVFNELVSGAVAAGITAEEAEDVLEKDWPMYSGLSFGGKCLNKDLKIWSESTGSSLGSELNSLNRKRVLKLNAVITRLSNNHGIGRPMVAVVGLTDAPDSTTCHNSPALQFFVETQHYTVSYADKATTKKFHDALSLNKRKFLKTDNGLDEANVVVLAQRAKDCVSIPFKHLMDVLRRSSATTKLVINACNGRLTDEQIIKIAQWGGEIVTVDQDTSFTT